MQNELPHGAGRTAFAVPVIGPVFFWKAVFWLVVAGVLLMALLPASEAPTVFASDKLNHMLAFAALAFLARILWTATSAAMLFGLLAVFGGMIELLQGFLDFGREADWLDLATDLLGIASGLLLARSVLTISRTVKKLTCSGA